MKAELLVSPRTLAQHMDDPTWVVFDCRHDLANPAKGRDAYAAAHIPGAHFAHLDTDLAGAKTGHNGRHPLPPLDAFAAFINRCGVTPESQVVLYDDAGGSYAGRLWWMLRWLGHDAVALLDGGWPAWVAQGLPTSTEIPAERMGAFVPRPLLGATVDAAYVERFGNDPAMKLVDARAPERYEGRNETIDPVAGHIPGAVNRFWKDNLAADGSFKDAATLRREFEQLLAGTDPERTMHSCGSGVTACHNAFAMTLAGLPTGRLYPGSWSEWCSDPARPIAKS